MASKRKPVERFDFSRIDAAKITITPQGFLKASGRLTRVGVLPYYRADGSVYRELRLPEEVFKADSVNSMKLAPVTDLHGGMVNPSNVQRLQVGIVCEDVDHDDRFVTGSALIQRQDTINAVKARERSEFSPGYQCWVEDSPGEWHGAPYDGIQRNIVYNHLAIGPKDWGRSGPEVALRMDGASEGAAMARVDSLGLGNFLRDRFSLLGMAHDEIAKRLRLDTFELGMLLDGFHEPNDALIQRISGLISVPTDRIRGFIPNEGIQPVRRKRDALSQGSIETKGNVEMKKITIVLDGVAYEVELPEALAPSFESSFGKLRDKAERVDTLEGELTVAKKEQTELQGKLDAANDPARLQTAIAERTKLVSEIKVVAPEYEIDEKLDSKALKVAALVSAGYEQTTFDGRDEGFINGVFFSAYGAAVAKAKADKTDQGNPPPVNPPTRSIGAAPPDPKNPPPVDKYDSEAARGRMVSRNREAWQQPLNYSLDV